MKVPLSTATSDEKAQYLALLNVVVERLLTLGKWRGCRQRAQLPIVSGHITLPRYLESCLGVNLSTCGLDRRTVYSMFAPFQIALHDGWTVGVIPVSENAQTFIVPAAGFQLKVVSPNSADNTKHINFINGVGTDGLPIYATEQLTLNNVSPPTSTTVWNTLPTIQKDATTGIVELYSIIGMTTELIGIYAPSETVPSYKRYKIGNPGSLSTAEALCKLAYVPAVDDTDLIFPSVMGALIKGLQAAQYEIASDDRDKARWADALKILEDDRVELDGKMQIVVEVVGEFGAGSTPNLTGDYWGALPLGNYAGGCP